MLLVTIGVNIYLFVVVPKGFFPQQDNGTIYGGIQGSQDISFQAMESLSKLFVDRIKSDPAVENATVYTGGNGAVNGGFVYIGLKPLNKRNASASQVITRLRPKLTSTPGATVFLQAGQDLRIGGRSSNAQFQYTIQSDSVQDLVKWGPLLLQQMKRQHGFTDVNSDQQNQGLQASLVYDRSTASRLGITPQSIDNTLYQAFGQAPVSTIYTPLNQYYVVMEVAPQFWQSPEGLKDVYVHPSSGGEVPLNAITRFQPSTAPLAVNHQGQFPSVTVSFNLAPGIALSDAAQTINAMELRMGFPGSIHGMFSGTLEAFQSSLATEPFLVITALMAVYIVLGILYESYIHPITILSTLPSAGVGAVLALMLFHTDLNVIALIGVILLIGIVKKNAILMIDFALAAERNEGMNSRDAIYQACLLRFRPILMTTMAALLGALPLALGRGTGSELRRPLGIAIVGGLIFSQMLTLYTTPIVYLYLDRMRLRRRARAAIVFQRRLLNHLWDDTWTKWLMKPTTGQYEFKSMTSLIRKIQPLPALFVSIFFFLAGCAVGPKYQTPAVQTPEAYKENKDWKVATPQDAAVREKWWEVYNDSQLNSLEEQVNVSNQSIAAAVASFEQARALIKEARSQYFPTVSANPAITNERTVAPHGQPASSNSSFTEYSLPFDASWEPDLWGRVRNTVRGNVAGAQASAADLENTRLSMQAELAVDYFQLEGQDSLIKLLDQTVAAYQESLRLNRVLLATGIGSDENVAQAETQLESTQALDTNLEIARAQYEHAIALLAGQPASSFSIPPAPLNTPPPDVPLGVPSQLLERRPDIASAERSVAQANAQIGRGGSRLLSERNPQRCWGNRQYVDFQSIFMAKPGVVRGPFPGPVHLRRGAAPGDRPTVPGGL